MWPSLRHLGCSALKATHTLGGLHLEISSNLKSKQAQYCMMQNAIPFGRKWISCSPHCRASHSGALLCPHVSRDDPRCCCCCCCCSESTVHSSSAVTVFSADLFLLFFFFFLFWMRLWCGHVRGVGLLVCASRSPTFTSVLSSFTNIRTLHEQKKKKVLLDIYYIYKYK